MRNRNGFTLIELLVVITIITVLAGLLIPGVLRAMKQAKTNRALSEMQHLATIITQVYSEVGYYVRLEDLIESTQANVRRWVLSTDYSTNGQDDSTISSDLTIPTPDVSLMWNGPYTTYKSYYTSTLQNYDTNISPPSPIPPNTYDLRSTINTQLTNAPLDPWGRPYRMFWLHAVPASGQPTLPVGTSVATGGTMVVISAGGNGIIQSLIGQEQRPTRAQQAAFNAFDPNNSAITEKDDVYYVFNAGIQ